MQLVHTENYPCFLASAFAPRPLRSVLFCTEEKPKSSSSSQQLLRGHIRQHNSYVCLTGGSSHPCPARAGSTLHILNRWARPRRFGTKLTTNKTAQGLRWYSLINHMHLCRRIRRTLSLWCLNPNWKTSPYHTDCAGLGSGRGCMCLWALALGQQGGSQLQRTTFTSRRTAAQQTSWDCTRPMDRVGTGVWISIIYAEPI